MTKPKAWCDPEATDRDVGLSWTPGYFHTQPLYDTLPTARRGWVELICGVRVEGDTVVVTVKGGNDAARELCGALLQEKNT